MAGVFLELNAYRLEAPEAQAVAAILTLTNRQMNEREFARWLRASCAPLPARPRKKPRRTPDRR